MEVKVRSQKRLEVPPEPTEYRGVPIVARLLVAEDDIAKLSTSKLSLTLKSSFFDEYAKGSLIDIIFLIESFGSTIYRYRMVSKSDEGINFRLECTL